MINLKKQIKKNPFLLAPMDSVTDISFRELAQKYGASYTCTELISVESLIRNKVPKYRYKKGKLKINCIQLFGSNPQSFKKACKIIEKEADIIDVNFGCPSTSVTKNNSGSALLEDPKNVGQIIQTLVKHSKKPITAKIRLGYKNQNFIEIAKIIEKNGASLITLHARTAKQKYSGTANWDAIKLLKNKIKIPLVGNGDIKNVEDIKFLQKHCDALMIGRSAIGNPYIFKEFNYFLKKKKKLKFNKKKIQKKIYKQYIKKINKIKYESENIKNIKIQKQSMWFFKSINGSKNLRKQLFETKNPKQIYKIIKKF